MPPIDPLQLLRALAPLLSSNGGMKSSEEVVRLSSLMKKFSRKLVSRCVYVNVLASTPSDVLESFLAEGGWDTINVWLQESKKNDNYPFILELLRLFKTLPMTVGRLKENNSAKLVKGFTKCEHEEVRVAAQNLMDDWMKLVKGEGNNSNTSDGKEVKTAKKKKKSRDKSVDGKKGIAGNGEEKDLKENSEKKSSSSQVRTSERKRSAEKEETVSKIEELEDVKLPEYLEKELSIVKKPKGDRPKTVKTYQAKFRSTGLEEASLPPKPAVKKNASLDKIAALAAKKVVKRIGEPPEKRPKPSSLIIPLPETTVEKPGIKLIPPKPKPIHIIKESAGFMDALVAEPAIPAKKKRKSTRSPTTSTPPLLPAVTPKLQFYKDTLETNENAKSEETEDGSEVMETSQSESTEDDFIKETNMETDQEANSISQSPKSEDKQSIDAQKGVVVKKSNKKKKSVSWAEEPQLRQIHFFELDETERVNVNNIKNFGDMKTLDRMKERQAVETARRMMMGDKMEEKIPWLAPILIDLPAALVEKGFQSTQRDIQHSREQSILQEIYFSKDSVPDSPHEPDPENVEPQEPVLIPLEDENNPDSVIDYSMVEMPQRSSLPPALSNLVLSLNNKTSSSSFDEFRDGAPDPFFKQPPPAMMQPGMLAPVGNSFGPFAKFIPEVEGGIMPGSSMPSDDGIDFRTYNFDNSGMPPMPHPGMGPPRMRMQGPMRGRGPMGPNRGRGGMQNQRGPNQRGRGGPHMRGRGQRTLCRHFANGTCKYEESCMFLHPGINGPLIN